jgi:hypothetical protein
MFNKGVFKSKLSAVAGGAQVPLPPQIQSVLNESPESLQGIPLAGTINAVQRKLDMVPLITAKQYREPLKYLCNEMPEVAYTHVESCTGAMLPATLTAHGLNNSWIKYTSAKFEAKAKVYVIAGTLSKVELGFGQYCIDKDHSAGYANGTAYRQCLIGHPAPGPTGFPIGDCSQDSDYPFYYRGTSYQCTHTCWEKLEGIFDQSRDFEVNDFFNWNGLPAQLQVTLPPNINPVNTLMTSLSRRQTFTIWLIRRTANGSHERLLRECTYTIGLDIAVAWAGMQPTCTITDASVVGPFAEKTFDAKRAAVTQKTLNNVEKMAMKLPQGAWAEV